LARGYIQTRLSINNVNLNVPSSFPTKLNAVRKVGADRVGYRGLTNSKDVPRIQSDEVVLEFIGDGQRAEGEFVGALNTAAI